MYKIGYTFDYKKHFQHYQNNTCIQCSPGALQQYDTHLFKEIGPFSSNNSHLGALCIHAVHAACVQLSFMHCTVLTL